MRLSRPFYVSAFLVGLGAGCAHEQPPPATQPTAAAQPAAPPKQPNPNLPPEVVKTLERLPTDTERLQEIARLDQENEEKKIKLEQMEKTVGDLQSKLDQALHGSKDPTPQGEAKVSTVAAAVASGSRVKVELSGELVFAPASARITRDGRRALDQIAEVLKTTAAKRIEVTGHTDSQPMGKKFEKKYEDNWQLSGERARRVLAYLHDKGVDGKHMVASGYADTDPVDTADTDDARRKNRRVEIFIEPQQ